MPALLPETVSFVHPATVGVALCLGLIPILVHLIARRRYRPVVWAAMPFLLAASGRSRRRVWLEHWLLMLTRIAVVVLLGLAIARPYIPAFSLLPVRSAHVHHVILLDNSLSMSARGQGGRTRFLLAREYAEQLVMSLPPADAVSLVTLAGPATAVIARAAYDRRFIRDRLGAIEPTQRAADTVGGIAEARKILADSEMPPANRAVYLISDLPRRLWLSERSEDTAAVADNSTPTIRAARLLADALPNPAVDFNLVRVAPEPGDNVAVTKFTSDSTLIAAGFPLRLMGEVTNFGQSTARNLSLMVRRDDEVIRSEPLPAIEPGGSTAVSIALHFSTAGTHVVEVKVVGASGDVLEVDNSRYLSIEVREAIPVLLVDGRPGATLLGGQSGFLATALAPSVPAPRSDWDVPQVGMGTQNTLFDAKVVSAGELEGEVLDDYDVVALCNVRRLSADQWHYLDRFVSHGGGMLVFGGDLISIDNYNRFGYAGGRGVLPLQFARPSDATPDDRRYTSFNPLGLAHPIVGEFAEHADSGLFLARVERHLSVTVDAARGDIVLRYTDDEPALIASTFGRGRVVVCTTTADMAWTNLPAKGDYVSLMLNIVAYLSPHHGLHRNVIVGQTMVEALTPLQSALPLRVRTERGMSEGRLVPLQEGLALEYGPVERAGVYAMIMGSQALAFVCNLDPTESDVAPADIDALAAALDRPVNMVSATDWKDAHGEYLGSTAGKSSELATFALCVVLAVLILEMWLAMWFGSHREGQVDAAVTSHRGRL